VDINHRRTRPKISATPAAPEVKENKPTLAPNEKPTTTATRPPLTPTRKPSSYSIPSRTPVKPAPSKKINRPSMQPTTTNTISTNTASAPTAAPEVMSDEGLFKFTVSRQARDGFSVQVGVFADYGNVLREVEKLDNAFGKDILVQISKLETKTVYKVLVGKFNDYTTASAFKEVVIANGSEGMVKDLTTL